MSIKIYNIIGMGFIIGEKIKQDDEKIYIKYPGMLLVGQQTRQGIQDLISDPIPNIFAGKNDLLKNFSIKKENVLYSGMPTAAILELYSRYSVALQEQITGIKIVSGNTTKDLPTIGRGGRILQ